MSILILPALLVRFPKIFEYLPYLSETSDTEVDDYLPQPSGDSIEILHLHESVDDLRSSPNPTTGK